jgi:hypothetical protein
METNLLIMGSIVLAFCLFDVVGIALSLFDQRWKVAAEISSLIGTILFGVSLFTLKRFYHLDDVALDPWPLFALGALLMALALSSTWQASLAAMLFAVWSFLSQSFESLFVPAFIVVIIGILAFKNRSRFLFGVVIVSFFVSIIRYAGLPPMALTLGTGLYASLFLLALGFLLKKERALFLAYGLIFFILLFFRSTFPSVQRLLAPEQLVFIPSIAAQTIYWVITLVLSLIAWAYVLQRYFTKKEFLPLWAFFPPLILILRTIQFYSGGTLFFWVYNFLFLAFGASVMFDGFKSKNRWFGILGIVLIVILATFRILEWSQGGVA